MKKVFCTSFLLFATVLCFSAQTGATDKVVSKGTAAPAVVVSEIPQPKTGCSHVPMDCPPSRVI